MSVEIVTFGCRLNTYESEVMRANAQKAGLQNTIIFNTCAVTAEAERQARQAIRRARKENPDAKIIVTGCSAQIKPETYAEMGEIDHVLGNEEKLSEKSYFDFTPQSEKIRVNDIMSVKETASHMVTSFDGRARAFVQVQNGCNHRCTFCIIPYGRGNSRSVPIGEIVQQTRALVESGYKEIVLTGVDISDYGKDLPGEPTLGQMMRRLLALVPELPRLRLSSIDAVEVDDDIFRLLAEEPRLMPHIHVSLQAGDDMILKRMKRRHSRKDAIDFCARVRDLRPDVVFGADIIAGFPTETEEMFLNTLNIVEEAGLTYLHVFPYSARSGTPAARMPQVAKELRKERAARLRGKGEEQLNKFYSSWIGHTTHAIVENSTLARTDHFAPVILDKPLASGDLIQVRITAANTEGMTGEVVN
ncbi:MAG TPA: tRNA (N(6)-L-threonylcarbamoyladenosine(37)-C(2))-methylthiotransferase MtaB [Rickettsiales bacterium]|nr:tRNA (N(6)-L-threonylcarbamoyladenosine(37)-C(2))-methylthiotransferase MtaB [Rickettsiales bacterium]